MYVHKSSVENAVGILEKGFFHDLEDNRYFTLEGTLKHNNLIL